MPLPAVDDAPLQGPLAFSPGVLVPPVPVPFDPALLVPVPIPVVPGVVVPLGEVVPDAPPVALVPPVAEPVLADPPAAPPPAPAANAKLLVKAKVAASITIVSFIPYSCLE